MAESRTKDTTLQPKCCNKPSWTALLLVSLLNGVFLCTIHSIYHVNQQTSLIQRVNTLESSLAVVTAYLLEEQRTGGYMFAGADNRQTLGRGKRTVSESTPNSTSDAADVALDVGTALLTALAGVCRHQGRLCIPGQKGSTGRSGIKGEKGVPGSKGQDGINGHPGIPGSKGSKGTQGEKGSKGGLGQTGRTGAPGVKGEPGTPGLPGDDGLPGEQGLQGERGETGESGTRGPKGDHGSKGNQGEKGEKGEGGIINRVIDNRIIEAVVPRNTTAKEDEARETPTAVSTHPSCHSEMYSVLKDTWRRESVRLKDTCPQQYSQNFQAGWYRFSKKLGSMIKIRCPEQQGCRAVAPGWMNGRHPTEVGVAHSRVVCFSYDGNCCSRQVTVEVVNCGDYYVYKLPSIPICHYEYCGNAY